MISPTGRAVLLLAMGAPFALLIGLVSPANWLVGLLWVFVWAALMAVDFILARSARSIATQPDNLSLLYIGSPDVFEITLLTEDDAPPPPGFEVRLETNELLSARQVGSQSGVAFELTPIRRGLAMVDALWMRWQGPFGLIYRQTRRPLNLKLAITPDTRTVAKEAIRLFSRDAMFGEKIEMDRGDGTQFDSLRDFTQGMDKRTIDWKQSARHRKLIAKEFRNERNHPIHFVIDTGRLMSQPVAGVPRIDRAVNAALLMGYVSLKMGDRVGLFAFDERPNVVTGAVSGAQSFHLLQRQAARIDYSNNETNFTLGLTRLSSQLDRRSLLVVFTDFADTTSAELMIENLGRLLRRHVVIFVAFQDEELEQLTNAEPIQPEDVTQAVIAAELLKERDIVLSRLHRMGAEIIEAPAGQINTALINRYLDLKNRDRL